VKLVGYARLQGLFEPAFQRDRRLPRPEAGDGATGEELLPALGLLQWQPVVELQSL